MSENNIETEEIFEKEINANTKSYSCKNCGADMKYLPEKNALYCEHCGTTIEIKNQIDAKEQILTGNLESGEEWLGSKTFICQSCSAIIDVPEGELSINCPFCGSANVISKDDISGIKPNAILPFKYGKEKAVEIYKLWVKNKWLLPRKLRKNFKQDDLKGLYVPIWTFDTSAVGTYKGRLGKEYKQTIKTKNGYTTVTTIKWFRVNGRINRGFDDIIIEASDHICDDDVVDIGGFDTENSIEYKEDYIAGFISEHYKDDLQSSFSRAKQKIQKYLEDEIKEKYNADKVDYIDFDLVYLEPTYKYVLAPLWICNYKYRKKDYRILLNGRNGQIGGKYPKAFWFYMLCALGIAAVVAGIVYYFFFT